MFENPTKNEIDTFLRNLRSIAVLGLSEDPTRPSYHVAKNLQKFGYRIVPVNPSAKEILGEASWPDLESAVRGAGPVDVAQVFRKPEHVAAIVDEVIRLKVPALWLQEGVVDAASATRASKAGIFTVMDRCMFKARSAMTP